jgi:hypothetical protein
VPRNHSVASYNALLQVLALIRLRFLRYAIAISRYFPTVLPPRCSFRRAIPRTPDAEPGLKLYFSRHSIARVIHVLNLEQAKGIHVNVHEKYSHNVQKNGAHRRSQHCNHSAHASVLFGKQIAKCPVNQ